MPEVPEFIEHRFVERKNSPFTSETPEELDRHGFEFVGNRKIGESFDPEDPPFDAVYREATRRLLEGVDINVTLRPPSFAERLDLRTFVLKTLRAGYEVRLIDRADGTVAMFRRFDLDRFITRAKGEKTADELLKEEGYVSDDVKSLEHWGDHDKSIDDTAKLKQYTDSALNIEKQIKVLAHEGFDVRLTEERLNNVSIIRIYKRLRGINEWPLSNDQPLTGITEELPSDLLRCGFVFIDNIKNDGSLLDIKGSPLLLDKNYRLATKKFLEDGFPHSIGWSDRTVRDYLITHRRLGNESRIIEGEYDAHTRSIKQEKNRCAHFARFDLGLSTALPDVLPKELLEQGYTFDKNLNFTAWGDALKNMNNSYKTMNENNAIREYVISQLVRDTHVRLMVGKYNPNTKKLDRTRGGIAIFRQ